MKKIAISISIVVIALLMVVFWFNQKSSKRYAGPIEKITIADALQPMFALIYIAEEKGYLVDEGLEVTYKSFTSGKDALTSVIKGKSDIATVFVTPVVLRTLEGEKLSVITELHNSSRNTGLIARKDRGINVPSDLRGKTIGVTKNTSGEFFLFLLLSSEGIRLSDITFVDTKPQDIARAFNKGSVDAIATWNPHLYNAKKSFSSKDVSMFFSSEYTESSMLAGKEDFVNNRPEAMKRLLKALVRAEAFLQENKGVPDILLDHLSNQSEDMIRSVWGNVNYKLRISNILLTALVEEAQWFIDNGFAKGPLPDFHKVLFVDYLKQIKPESVTIF